MPDGIVHGLNDATEVRNAEIAEGRNPNPPLHATRGPLRSRVTERGTHDDRTTRDRVRSRGRRGEARVLRSCYRGAGIAALPHPASYTAEGKRVLFTFAGVGIGLVVMFIADRMQKHSAKATMKPA